MKKLYIGILSGLVLVVISVLLYPRLTSKNYVNKNFYFQFSYPRSWTVTSENSNFVSLSAYSKSQTGPFINIQIIRNSQNQSLDQWATSTLAPPFRTATRTLIKISGLPAYRFSNPQGQVIAFVNKEYLYVWYLANNGDAYQSIGNRTLNQIASSFRFYSDSLPHLPSAANYPTVPQIYMPDTSNWKIYSNTKYAYSISFPPELEVKCANEPCTAINNVYFVQNSSSDKQIDIDILSSLPDGADIYTAPVPLPGQPYVVTYIPLRFQQKVIRIMISNKLASYSLAQPIVATFHYLNPAPVLPTPTILPNYRTYTNSQYGFSFNYPMSYKINDTPETIITLHKPNLPSDYITVNLNSANVCQANGKENSVFSDFAIQAAICYSYADGVSSHSGFDYLIDKDKYINSYGLSGISMNFHWSHTNQDEDKQIVFAQATIGPIISLEVTTPTRGQLRGIEISGPKDNSGTKSNQTVVENIANSLRFSN